MKKTAAIACAGTAALALGLSGCGASFEGSGSKDAASAEQLAMHASDPWDAVVQADPQKKCATPLADGVYTGVGQAMAGNVTVTLLVDDNRITCLQTTQDGESQSVGGFEAVRDGTFARMIEAAQSSDIDTVSGATITTAGVKQAVDDALAQAAEQPAEQAQSSK